MPNRKQTNSDRDNVGDACDNCPVTDNADQVGDKYQGSNACIFFRGMLGDFKCRIGTLQWKGDLHRLQRLT